MIMRIAYGWKRKDADFDGFDITPGKFYLDDKPDRPDLQTMVDGLRPGEIVVLLDRADLGRGFQVTNRIAAIKGTGAVIEAHNVKPKRKTSDGKRLTPEKEAAICEIWGNKLMSADQKIARIEDELGVVGNRDRFNYLCLRKPKRQSGGAQTLKAMTEKQRSDLLKKLKAMPESDLDWLVREIEKLRSMRG